MNNYKILIAEDNILQAEAISKILLDVNIECKIVNSGIGVIEEYYSDYYNLIPLDILMPKMNGLVASKEIRKSNSIIPIIGFSSIPYQEIEQELADCGINDYLTKPRKLSDLKTKLQSYFKAAA